MEALPSANNLIILDSILYYYYQNPQSILHDFSYNTSKRRTDSYKLLAYNYKTLMNSIDNNNIRIILKQMTDEAVYSLLTGYLKLKININTILPELIKSNLYPLGNRPKSMGYPTSILFKLKWFLIKNKRLLYIFNYINLLKS